MPNKNICKFVTVANQDRLEVHRFIYESDSHTMRLPHILNFHRAMLISGGTGAAVIEGKSWNFQAGTMIFALAGEEIYINPEDRCD